MSEKRETWQPVVRAMNDIDYVRFGNRIDNGRCVFCERDAKSGKFVAYVEERPLSPRRLGEYDTMREAINHGRVELIRVRTREGATCH